MITVSSPYMEHRKPTEGRALDPTNLPTGGDYIALQGWPYTANAQVGDPTYDPMTSTPGFSSSKLEG